ncbi:hypothetical protein, partial [Marinobacter lipolyticus]|uniref:hypothetical protein n=1 Tax=Marinobacter lipolyticus TaxID=209639 RepID=UPI003A912E50
MSLSVCLIVGRRTLITHAPILGDGYIPTEPADKPEIWVMLLPSFRFLLIAVTFLVERQPTH